MQRNNDIPNLGYLLQGLVPEDALIDIPVNELCIDSRDVTKGDLFIALNGAHTNSSEYIDDAIKNGAAAILLETNSRGLKDSVSIPVYKLNDLRSKLGLLASRFYDNPSQDCEITGITGTNGKTSVAYFLAQVMTDQAKLKVGSIGTLGSGIFGSLKPCANTTPDVISINKILNDFRSENIKHVVMEVSSHGLEQDRIKNISFETAVFTNLSRDHLDYHGDMSLYAESKKKLFQIPGLKNAVINTDDEFGRRLALEINSQVNTFRYGVCDANVASSTAAPDLSARIKEQSINSLLLDISSPWGQGELSVSLSGVFNAYNVLACVGVLCIQGMPFDEVLVGLSRLKGVPGRMEYFGAPNSANIFIDYSHTPDALMQALNTLRRQCTGSLTVVFGCGGDRDKGKRSEMGRIAEQYADRIFLTNDNPRTELPEKIIDDIRSGMSGASVVKVLIDRSAAIREAVQSAAPGDYVLISGKGHETYQEIGSIKHPFSDRQQVRNLLELLR